MFIGEYQHSLDDKGRVSVPVKFRRDLVKGAVVTRGLDNCLWLFPKEEWNTLAEKLSRLPLSQANTRAFSRLMLAGAMEASLDRQGRVVLPDYLRAFATLKKKAVLAGLYNRVEIWDEASWALYKGRTERKSNEVAEQLTDLGV